MLSRSTLENRPAANPIATVNSMEMILKNTILKMFMFILHDPLYRLPAEQKIALNTNF